MVRNNPFGLRAKLNVENMSVDFSVIDKKEDKEVETKSFKASDIHSNLHKMVALYGLSKLLQDRSSDTPTGPGKLVAMEEVAVILAGGEWERERKVGAPVVRPEVEALAQLKGCTVADIQATLKKYTKEAREKVFANPKVIAAATAIRAARETASVDLSDLQ